MAKLSKTSKHADLVRRYADLEVENARLREELAGHEPVDEAPPPEKKKEKKDAKKG